MKGCLFLCICIVLLSCKKEEQVRLYPKTYELTGHQTDYKVWIGDRDVTSTCKPSLFFSDYLLSNYPGPITLINDHELMFDGATGSDPYFFRNDSLFFLWQDPSQIPEYPDTIWHTEYLCPGNYSFLNLTFAMVAEHSLPYRSLDNHVIEINEYMTREKYIDFWDTKKVWDTLAIQNNTSFYR